MKADEAMARKLHREELKEERKRKQERKRQERASVNLARQWTPPDATGHWEGPALAFSTSYHRHSSSSSSSSRARFQRIPGELMGLDNSTRMSMFESLASAGHHGSALLRVLMGGQVRPTDYEALQTLDQGIASTKNVLDESSISRFPTQFLAKRKKKQQQPVSKAGKAEKVEVASHVSCSSSSRGNAENADCVVVDDDDDIIYLSGDDNHLWGPNSINCLSEECKAASSACIDVVSSEGEFESEDEETTNQFACSICLDEMRGSEVRRLPCLHYFHVTCIDEWLMKHDDKCPICKHHLTEP